MDTAIGSKVKDKHAKRWLGALAEILYPGEEVTALSKTNLLRPMCDGLAVTTARIIAFYSHELTTKGAAREILADRITQVELRKKSKTRLTVVTTSNDEIVFGDLPEPDAGLILGAAQQLAASGTPSVISQEIAARDAAVIRQRSAWDEVTVVGQSPSDKAWKAIQDHAAPGETAWFVIGSGSGGALAAFEDRCLIVKVGALTTLMSGSFGGGRITTFPYSEITGIEYNSGLINGVLEILTPSYQGTANKDFWRGSISSRNANSNDPYTLSNTLPLDKPLYQQVLPHLNEMRSKIANAKQPTGATSAQHTEPGRSSHLTEELSRLAELHEQGILDREEFASAKQAAIARHASKS